MADNSNSMEGVTINKGILDRFLDYTRQTYQAMTSKKSEPEPELELCSFSCLFL